MENIDYLYREEGLVNSLSCKVQIHELSWFNHQFIILSQFLTMLLKYKIRSIIVSNKWKTWYIKSESKTSIFLSYFDIFFHIISLSLCQLSYVIYENI